VRNFIASNTDEVRAILTEIPDLLEDSHEEMFALLARKAAILNLADQDRIAFVRVPKENTERNHSSWPD
jgi:hypothetical protein